MPHRRGYSGAMNQAILYLRVSRDEQVRGTSLDTQEATARDLCARVGFVVAATYREEGESGAYYHARPELQAALSRVESLRAEGHAVALVFARLDRAARDVGAHQEIERRLSRCGAVQLYCDGTPGGDRAADEYARNIMRAGTQFDRAQIRERTMQARKRRAQEGRQPSRTHSPIGYYIVKRADVYPGSLYSPDDIGRYVMVPEQGAVVREIWARAVAGESMRAIARAMEAAGHPTTQGGKWRGDTIRTILTNPTYKGEAPYGRDSHHQIEDAGRVRTISHRRDASEVVYIPCPAYVSASEWQGVQERIATHRHSWGGNPHRRALLSGLLRCPTCGRGLFLTRMVRGYYYVCDGGRQQPVTCSRRRWQGPALERLVVGVVGEIATSPAVVASVLSGAASVAGQSGSDVRALQRAVETARRAEEAAVVAEVQARADGRDAAPYVSMVAAATKRRQEAVAALESAEPAKAQSFDAGALIRLCGEIGPALADDAIPMERRAGWVRRLVRSVVPFETGEPAPDAHRNPLPGAVVTLVSPDSVGSLVVRATLSGDGVVIVGADGG